MRGRNKRPRRRFRSAQLVIKIKGKSLAGMAEFADDRRRQGVPRVRFAPPSPRARLFAPAAEDPIPGRSVHRKTCGSLLAPAGRLSRNPAATVSHLPCQLSITIRPESAWIDCYRHSASRTYGKRRMTNRFGIYLCRGSCCSELVGRVIGLPWLSLAAVSCLCYFLPMLILAYVTGQAMT